MSTFVFAESDPTRPDVAALLATHLAFAREVTPPDDVHALDARGLMEPDVSLFEARENETLVAVGALRHLDPSHVEIKSMHTAAAFRGRGAGRAMLEHLVATARSRAYRRVSLETGTMPAFDAARSLYASHGFDTCEPFGQYQAKANNVCMTLNL